MTRTTGTPRTPGTPGSFLERLAAVECPAFGHRRRQRTAADPVVLARGEGTYVWDVDGRRYLDLAAGFGSVLLGHGHPALKAAIAAQSEILVQGLGDVAASDVKVNLLEALARLHGAPDAQVLLGQSGADAVTAAMKTATLATGRHGFVAFDGAYHGLGYAPLAACGFQRSFREPFAPQLSPSIRFTPFPGVRGATPDAALAMLRETIDDAVAAVIVEPILGRGGCVVPPPGFLAAVAELARERGALLIADEIWTGMGRSGSMVRSRSDGVEADILCFGKGLGGGVSVSACVASAAVMRGWEQGEAVHTSTHVGAPLACACALATLQTLERERLVERAAEVGDCARAELAERLGVEVSGAGLMLGIRLESAAALQHATGQLLERGFLAVGGGVQGDVLTLTPALTIEPDALRELGRVLAEIRA